MKIKSMDPKHAPLNMWRSPRGFMGIYFHSILNYHYMHLSYMSLLISSVIIHSPAPLQTISSPAPTTPTLLDSLLNPFSTTPTTEADCGFSINILSPTAKFAIVLALLVKMSVIRLGMVLVFPNAKLGTELPPESRLICKAGGMIKLGAFDTPAGFAIGIIDGEGRGDVPGYAISFLAFPTHSICSCSLR
jgi:hypothetical protein